MYHYEVLGDERFQEFCQSLISAAFPNVQCLPVGQPDGGRDAFLVRYLHERQHRQAARELIVFQVKYVRNRLDTRDEREMIEEVASKEKSKIEKLKSAGLAKYYLITNVKGTAHLDAGSIDRVNRILSELLGIEAYCWWRDDLDRRLDSNSSVKWSYPEVLKATDLLEALVSGRLGESEERRRSAVRAYMTAQYDEDQHLKFKQTELRSTITDLFVDLPMRRSPHAFNPESARVQRYNRSNMSQSAVVSEEHFIERQSLDSAEHFIRLNGELVPNKILLEGAPGQGKSTITQYICQVMRMRLLDKHADLMQLPKQHWNTKVRIPFRVDLRDLAKWISGIDPFQPKPVALAQKEPSRLLKK